MPLKRSHVGRLAALAALATAAALPSGALAAGTAAGCTIPAGTQAFAQFGDTSSYYLPSGGNFEQANGWKTSGNATLQYDNDPFNVTGLNSQRTSYRLPSGASVRSGRFCISADTPHLRFTARSIGSGPLTVQVDSYSTGGTYLSTSTQTISAADHGAWAPTANVALPTTGMAAGDKALAQVTLISNGDWLADDVMVDPYAR